MQTRLEKSYRTLRYSRYSLVISGVNLVIRMCNILNIVMTLFIVLNNRNQIVQTIVANAYFPRQN